MGLMGALTAVRTAPSGGDLLLEVREANWSDDTVPWRGHPVEAEEFRPVRHLMDELQGGATISGVRHLPGIAVWSHRREEGEEGVQAAEGFPQAVVVLEWGVAVWAPNEARDASSLVPVLIWCEL